MWTQNTKVMANATLSGVSFAIVALGWKGFVYGPGILFIAFAFQIFFKMFRRRDSLPITAASLQMMLTAFVIPLPFYCWPELNLLFDPSGFQPMFYIIGFTFALGWISSSYRDRPWLLVLGSTVVLMGSILAVLWTLQSLNIYDGWDVLFTGGFYFSKNKIF
jgi:asparagine N-glycosylation enzyme membrane subunit Stt3